MDNEHPFLSRLELATDHQSDPCDWFAERMRCKDGTNTFSIVVRAILSIAPERIQERRLFVTCSLISKRYRIDRRQVHEVLNKLVDHEFMKKGKGNYRREGHSRNEHGYLFYGGDVEFIRNRPIDKGAKPILLCEKNRAVIEEVLGRRDTVRELRRSTSTSETAEQTEVEQDGEYICRRHGLKAGELHFENEVDAGVAGTRSTTSTSGDDEREYGDKHQQEADAEVVT